MSGHFSNLIFFFVSILSMWYVGCEELEKTIAGDTKPPIISLTSPANNATLNGRTILKADASDDNGIRKVQFIVDGTIIQSDSIAPYEYEWDPGYWADDNYHTLMVKAYDLSNNTTQSNVISVKIPLHIKISPSIVFPKDQSFVDNDTIKIVWLHQADAINYDVEVSNNSTFTSKTFTAYSIIDTAVLISVLQKDMYFLRIRGKNSFGVLSPWSDPIVFYTKSQSFNVTYGGMGTDNAMYAIQLTTGSYLTVGITNSFGKGGGDGWVVKTNSSGEKIWDKTFGGLSEDRINFVAEVPSGGYLFAGYTRSLGSGGEDGYLIKTDTGGTVIWEKLYGGSGDDAILSIVNASDGSVYCTGYTSSYGNNYDAWIIKTDPNGNELWKKYYGGTGGDFGQHLEEVADGFVMSGVNGSIAGNSYDFWLMKIDKEGTVLWNRTYGTISDERAIKFARSSDGGYILTGYKNSGSSLDVWLLKTDNSGNQLWNKLYGGSGNDFGIGITATSKNEIVFTGYTSQNGNQDLWLVKTDYLGNVLWEKKIGGVGTESGSSVKETKDRGYIISGWTTSIGSGGNDMWLLKVDQDGLIK